MMRILTLFSLIVVLCFAAILTLQVMEHVHYRAEPSVWTNTP